MLPEIKAEAKLDAKLDVNKLIDQMAGIVGEKTKKGLCNAGDLTLISVVQTLKERCEEGEITVEDLLKKLNGMSYTKDVSKYLGRTKKIRFSFIQRKRKTQHPKCP